MDTPLGLITRSYAKILISLSSIAYQPIGSLFESVRVAVIYAQVKIVFLKSVKAGLVIRG